MTFDSYLSFLLLIPLVGAGVILTIAGGGVAKHGRNVRHVALWTSVSEFLLTLYLAINFEGWRPGVQMVEKSASTFFGIRYHLGIDGISLVFVLLTAFLVMVTIFVSCRGTQQSLKAYMISFLLMESLMVGAFVAQDVFLFFIFFEALLIPMFFVIGFWGGEKRLYATFVFFLYTFFGSLALFVALVYIYQTIGSFSVQSIVAYPFTLKEQIWLFWGFFLAFAIKVPMLPVHTWLPDTYVEAPLGGSVILAGILSTLGGYGLLRFVISFFPEASLLFQPLVFFLSALAVVYASFVAFAQSDAKRLVAYSSVAHMGIVTLGIFSLGFAGVQGAVFQMVSHAILSAALFILVGFLKDRFHTYDMQAFGGLARSMPVFSTMFMIAVLGAVGLPGTIGFVGELLVFLESVRISPWLGGMAVTGVVFSAMYFLVLYKNIFLGEASQEVVQADLTTREVGAILPMILCVLALGIFPYALIKVTSPSVHILLNTSKAPASLAKLRMPSHKPSFFLKRLMLKGDKQ
ncbi:complex I subunit 4 family protein [Candidatus Hepatobacter penaei]|uniref:complex I subunit 4 family protein n=1 Tax=Candidatus Hepatobacter penaei TaxID=1274402 RepID=UPI000699138D|nr:NADH-quinone oxidoreductase subunit M [Candidatus Hepatobacter penaei]TGW15795.1 NADH-quinone oxidoreductase subunit M [bacterium NHP-B]